jgi:guanine nucleotide-binding protein subunit alpha
MILTTAYNVKEGDKFPPALLGPLQALWNDPGVQTAYRRGNEVALPDRWVFRSPPHSRGGPRWLC